MSELEAIKEAIKQLTGAINAQIELNKKLEIRIQKLEGKGIASQSDSQLSSSTPKTEEDLKEISRLPDCVRELQIFDGNPTQYISWIHTVECILKDYEIVKHKPIYRAILQCIRYKIRGSADAALVAYNIFNEDWCAIKKCLSLHYADKRDLRTLEHQLSGLNQKNMSVDEFYATVNHHFSLIVNKLKTEEYSDETTRVLIETYRNRALDVFIRGLNGEMSKILMIQRPSTLPEAYTSCLEMQNVSFRNLSIHGKNFNNTIVSPINQMSAARYRPSSNPPVQMPVQKRNQAYNIQHQQSVKPPPRPSHPKPPVPMDVDQSIQTRQVNYVNRPIQYPAIKRDHENSADNQVRKQQRIFNLDTGDEDITYEEYVQQRSDVEEVIEEQLELEENPELNFMMGASPAYLI